MQTLPEWLQQLVFGGGAGVIAFGAIELLKQWPQFKAIWDKIPSDVNRYISFAIAGLLGGLGFWAQVKLGYEPVPGNLTGWTERLFSIVVSQIVYSGFKLARKRA